MPRILKTLFRAPGEVLARFMKSNKRVRIIIGPLGSGKTTTSVHETFSRIVRQKANAAGERKSRWVIIRNTYPDLQNTTIKDWREEVTDAHGKFKWSPIPTHDLDFMLEDGTRVISEVIFLALDLEEHVKKLRGMQLTGGWMNEMKEMPQSVFEMLDSRIGRYPSRAELGNYWHGIIGDTNCPDDEHYLYELWLNCPDNTRFFIQPGGVVKKDGKWVINEKAENRQNLPVGYYENIIQGKREDWIDVNVGNNWGSVRDGRPVHPDFSYQTHRSEQPLEVLPSTIFVGIDFGRTPCAVFGQKDIMGRVRIIDELVTDNMGALKFGQELRRYVNERYEGRDIEYWADPAGEGQAQTRDETPFDMLRLSGIDAFPTWTNDPGIRINSVDALLTTLTDGQPNFLVSSTCKTLVKGLNSGYCFRKIRSASGDRYEEKPSKGKYSHVCDALQYLVLGSGESNILTSNTPKAEEEALEEYGTESWHPTMDF